MPDLNTLLKAEFFIKSVSEQVRTFAKKFGSFVAVGIARTVMHCSPRDSRVMHWSVMHWSVMHRSAREERLCIGVLCK